MPQAHTEHHHHLELAELVWLACLEVTDESYALTPRRRSLRSLGSEREPAMLSYGGPHYRRPAANTPINRRC